MKTHKFILFIFISVLFCNGSCEKSIEGQCFIIRNNTDKTIVVQFATDGPISHVPSCMKPSTQSEYEKMTYQKVVFFNSEKNFERNKIGEYLISHPNDTLYIGIFYRSDIDRMSCEEFKQIFPLKKEWKVTLADMKANDWTLVYTLEE